MHRAFDTSGHRNDRFKPCPTRERNLVNHITKMIDEFIEVPRFPDESRFDELRESLLRIPAVQVMNEFVNRLESASQHEELRGHLLERLVLLFEHQSTDLIIHWIDDPAPAVRWYVCECLHDFGNSSVTDRLLQRLLEDSDCQVRVAAAGALGSIGSPNALPDLHIVSTSDHEVDLLGYTPASTAIQAISSQLFRWVCCQIRGNPSLYFEENIERGRFVGSVTAQGLSRDSDVRVSRYRELPHKAFGFGMTTKLSLSTTLVPDFEVMTTFSFDQTKLKRIFLFSPFVDPNEKFDCSIVTIVDVDLCCELLSQKSSPPV